MDARAGSHARDRGRLSPPQLEEGEQVEREGQVLGDRRDDVVLDRQAVAHRGNAARVHEVRHHGHAAAGVSPLVLDLSSDVQRARHHDLSPERQSRVVGYDRLGHVGQLDGDPAVPGHTEPRQGGGEPVDVVLESTIAEPAIEEDDRRPVPVLRRGTHQELRQRKRLEVERR